MQLFFKKNSKKFPKGVDMLHKMMYHKSVLKETQGGEQMNVNELKAELARQNLTIPKLADLIHLSKKTLYSRMKGETSFTQVEISSIANALSLSKNRILEIFFNEKVA